MLLCGWLPPTPESAWAFIVVPAVEEYWLDPELAQKVPEGLL
ncbi:MAG TPA: hypothetical protein VGR78_14105 [Verrucomicrobiae bacterium]|nr:hypothetical protein [Verrucomicrobiae bacterium]